MLNKKDAAWITPVLIASIGTALIGGAACARKTELYRAGIDPAPEAQASKNVSDSFSLSQDPLTPEDNYFLALKKDALGKEFLLHGSIIPQTEAATSHGLQARVVSFHRVLDKVFLLQSSQGQVVTHELPSTLILAEIPILRETDDKIVLDFNRGMSKALTAGNWYGADIGSTFTPTEEFAKVMSSFIQSAELRSDAVELRQIAQVDISTASGTHSQGFELRYFISPYHPNPNFVPRETSDFQNVGYFEVAPKIEPVTGRVIRHISRWDDSKPITYYVSANTPSEYVQAVREGILYWNKVFGREVIRAEVAPQGVTAPDPRYNIVQWVDNDSAGSAYADALMDPRSGEILHSQVYLTSVFAVQNRARVPSVLRRLKEQHKSHTGVGPKFLKASRLCDLEESQEFSQSLENLLADGASDADLSKATRNYLTLVTAHEVGHTLGLRHNFAGSLAENVTNMERDEMFLKYLVNNETPAKDAVFTSSVMEYNGLAESVLSIASIRESGTPLPYDKLAIGWGYHGKGIDPRTAPLFCTDSHAEEYKDCVRFDSGSSAIANQVEKMQMNLKTLPIAFVEEFIEAKTAADVRDRNALERVKVQLNEYVTPFTTALKEIAPYFRTAGVPSIRFERMFPYASDFNHKDILAAEQSWVKEETAKLGGLGTVLFSFLPTPDGKHVSISAEMMKNLDAYLSRESVRHGTGYDGKPYELTASDIDFIRNTGAKVFARAEEAFLSKALEILGTGTYAQDLTGETMEALLGNTAAAILLTQTYEIVPGPDFGIVIQKFKYSETLRVKAVRLLANSLGESIDWSGQARGLILNGLKTIITNSLGGSDPDKVDPTRLSRAQKQWLQEQVTFFNLVAQTANQ